MPGKLRYIERIENVEGEVVYQSPGSNAEGLRKQACDEVTAFQIHEMLRESLRTGNLANEASQLDPDPFPGVELTVMRPPWSWTIFWQRNSPNPVPLSALDE